MEDTPPIEGGGEDGAEPSPAGATDPGMGKAAAARGRVGKKERKMKRERRQRWRSASSGVISGTSGSQRRSGSLSRSRSMTGSSFWAEEEKPGWNDRFWVGVAKDNKSYPMQCREFFDSFGAPAWAVSFNESWRGIRRGGFKEYGTVKEEYDHIDNVLRERVYAKPSLMADGFCQSNCTFNLKHAGFGARRGSRLPPEPSTSQSVTRSHGSSRVESLMHSRSRD